MSWALHPRQSEQPNGPQHADCRSTFSLSAIYWRDVCPPHPSAGRHPHRGSPPSPKTTAQLRRPTPPPQLTREMFSTVQQSINYSTHPSNLLDKVVCRHRCLARSVAARLAAAATAIVVAVTAGVGDPACIVSDLL